MAIRWQCPSCHQPGQNFGFAPPASLQCGECAAEFSPAESLCEVCDAPNPWSYRDSIHLWCRNCGNTQMLYSHLRSA
jgi:ribosomal protein S27E